MKPGFTLLAHGLLWLAALGAPLAWAEVKVFARGLFADRALLEINGVDRLVRAGQRTEEGVLLVSSTSRQAVVEIDGVRTTLELSGQIASEFTEAPRKEVRVTKSQDSHFRVQGAINGYPVEMLVDTGATAVAMNANDAARLGIRYQEGQQAQASTAGGLVNSYVVDINRVSVGDIEVYNIKGIVIEGDFPSQILLGNTFLSHVTMEQDASALILRSKF